MIFSIVHCEVQLFNCVFIDRCEVLFANWGPACRVLTENYSEYFSVFFLFYRQTERQIVIFFPKALRRVLPENPLNTDTSTLTLTH